MPLIPAGDMQEVSLALYSPQENLLDDSTRKVLLMFTPIVSFQAIFQPKPWTPGRIYLASLVAQL